MPQFVDQDAKAREDKAAFDRQNRFPQTPEDAIALLVERGYGTRESLSAALDGRPETGVHLPAKENLQRPNEQHALGVLNAHRSAIYRPAPVEPPKYTLPDPKDPALTLRGLLEGGAVFVDQFRQAYPDDFARLQRLERARMAGANRPAFPPPDPGERLDSPDSSALGPVGRK